ncbi:MAG: peptide ABC transporter substrate-binding protein [Eubacterium sp.]|nr:peptide ABC transporter substrate-binding protein [Eubacterium sp.]
MRRKQNRISKFVSGLLIVSLFLTGCAASKAIEGTVEDETITVGMSSRPSSLDPQKSNDVTSYCSLKLLYGTLYREDENGDYVPGLAKGYDISADGLTATIHLRDGLYYSNGDPIIADDIVYSIRRLADPLEATDMIRVIQENCKLKNIDAISEGKMSLDKLGVSAPDDKTIVLNLEQPCSRFESVISTFAFSPCQKKFFKSCNGHYASSPETLLSSGAFIIDRYEPLGTQIHFVKNPNYYDKDSIKLSEITYQCVSDPQQAIMSYQTGLVDLTEVKGEFITLAENDKSLMEKLSGVVKFVSVNERSSNKACNNVNLRLALANAIDRQEICDKLMYGAAKPLTRYVPTDVQKDENGKDIGADEDKYSDICGNNPDKAKEYYDKALKELGTDKVSYDIITTSSSGKMVEVLTDGWKKVLPGISFKIRTMPDAQFYASLMNDDYDMCAVGLTCDKSEIVAMLQILRTGNAMNMSGYSNKVIDQDLDAMEIEMDPGKMSRLTEEAEKIAMQDMPVIPLFSSGSSWLVAEQVQGFVAPGDGIIDVSRVWKKGA